MYRHPSLLDEVLRSIHYIMVQLYLYLAFLWMSFAVPMSILCVTGNDICVVRCCFWNICGKYCMIFLISMMCVGAPICSICVLTIVVDVEVSVKVGINSY